MILEIIYISKIKIKYKNIIRFINNLLDFKYKTYK